MSMSFEDKLQSDGKGNRFISGETFSNVTFSDFTIRPSVGTTVTLERLVFENCKVSPGTCVIRKGSILKDVTFTEFECGDAIHISSEVALENVVIKGKRRPRMIWLKPQNKEATNVGERPDFLLDITEFYREVSITGVPVDKIKLNPDLHIKIKCDLFESHDLKSMGIGGLSYWNILLRKVIADGSREGVFSVPLEGSRNYEKSMGELELLRNAGVVELKT